MGRPTPERMAKRWRNCLWSEALERIRKAKALVRTVISRIVFLEKTDAATDLEIEWIDGRRQRSAGMRRK